MRKRKMGWLLGIVFMGMALGITGCREGSREQAPQAEGEPEGTEQMQDQQQEEGQEESQPSEQTDGEESDSKEQKEQEQAQPDAAVISGRLFSITMPKELDGLYDAETDEYGDISIYEKTSREEFGGFVFGIFAYEDPAEYAQLPSGHKLGELTDAEGKTYDLVVEYPTDVQFDPEGDAHEKYSSIMDAAQQATESIIAVDGVYRAGAGMQGEDLYGEVLQKYVTAVREEWGPDKLEQENMSYMYAMRYSGEQEKDPLDVIGYYYCDLTGDGVDELFIGELSEYEEYKGII
ncbi:MAG: hypothetical protein IJ711_04350, partial [Lachnospiraceae bacterium]|nr:hypothetical protein [Lachnospiraceae bacterium]